jgi:multidrug efflux pump subunit AcrA (membrane-fusion protein)
MSIILDIPPTNTVSIPEFVATQTGSHLPSAAAGNRNPSDSFRPLGRLLLLLCVFLLTCLGCSRNAKPAEEPKKDPPAPIKWENARLALPEEWTVLVGTTQPLPEHAARVTSSVTARVVAVLPKRGEKSISEGQEVEQGDVLVELDATQVVANLAKAEAAKQVLLADREVAVLAHKQAALDLKSLQELKKNQTTQAVLVSPVMLEKGALAVDSAQASVSSIDRKLEAADKEVAALNIEKKLYTLTAPRKGRLGRLQVAIGQTLSAGSSVAEILSIDDEIDVLCFASAADARKLQNGQLAKIGDIERDPNVPEGPDGKVVYISDQAEPDTGSVAIKVRFPNKDLKLRASTITRVRILTKPAIPGKQYWVVPETALLEDQEPPAVVIVEGVTVVKNAEGKEEQFGKARRLQVVIGVRDRYLHYVEIVRLEDRDKKWPGGDIEQILFVIAKGQGLQTGDSVKLEEEEEEEPPKPAEKAPEKP